MAEIGVTQREDRDPGYEHTGFRLSWGAIFAGFVIATALQMVLSVLGAAIGFAAFDPGQGDSAGSLGIGAAIWFAVTALISMYMGGRTTGYLAGIISRGTGMLHGVVMWGLSTLLAIYLASSGVSQIVGGAFSALTQTAASTAGGVVSGAGQMGAAEAQNPGSTEQLADRAGGAAQDALGQAQAQVQQQGPELRERAGQAADEASNTASKAAWGALLVMGLSVAAAAFGAGSSARE